MVTTEKIGDSTIVLKEVVEGLGVTCFVKASSTLIRITKTPTKVETLIEFPCYKEAARFKADLRIKCATKGESNYTTVRVQLPFSGSYLPPKKVALSELKGYLKNIESNVSAFLQELNYTTPEEIETIYFDYVGAFLGIDKKEVKTYLEYFTEGQSFLVQYTLGNKKRMLRASKHLDSVSNLTTEEYYGRYSKRVIEEAVQDVKF